MICRILNALWNNRRERWGSLLLYHEENWRPSDTARTKNCLKRSAAKPIWECRNDSVLRLGLPEFNSLDCSRGLESSYHIDINFILFLVHGLCGTRVISQVTKVNYTTNDPMITRLHSLADQVIIIVKHLFILICFIVNSVYLIFNRLLASFYSLFDRNAPILAEQGKKNQGLTLYCWSLQSISS